MYTVADNTYYDLALIRHQQILHRQLVIMERLDEEPWRKQRGDAVEKSRNWRADLNKLKHHEAEELIRDIQLQQAKPSSGLSMGGMVQLAFLIMMLYNAVAGK